MSKGTLAFSEAPLWDKHQGRWRKFYGLYVETAGVVHKTTDLDYGPFAESNECQLHPLLCPSPLCPPLATTQPPAPGVPRLSSPDVFTAGRGGYFYWF